MNLFLKYFSFAAFAYFLAQSAINPKIPTGLVAFVLILTFGGFIYFGVAARIENRSKKEE